MTKIDDGGQAFPNTYPLGSNSEGTPGMSLRDWFAGQAMSIAARENYAWGDVAKAAYQLADAMLAARKKDAES